MVRNQYSYWLTAKLIDPNRKDAADRVERLMAALNASSLNDDFIFEYDDKTLEISGEIEGGSIEENTSFSECVRDIAKRFPDFTFSFEESDEDDHANGCLTEYANGIETFCGYRRTMEPNELDQVTAKDIIAHLTTIGNKGAADAIAAYVKANTTRYGTFN